MDFPSSVIPQSHILHAPFSTGVQRQFSRYFNEFEELQLLGKGAFGAVIKVGSKASLDDVTLASKLFVDLTFSPSTFPLLQLQVQNNLDGCYYAVKRILVNPASKQFRRIKGEVTLLSRLNHENIVRYYNAWIERHETPSGGMLSNTDSSEPWSSNEKPPQRKESPKPINEELGLADNVEDAAPPPALSSSVEWSTSIERSSSAKCSRHQSSDEEDDEDEEEDVFGASFL